ncbi:MAG TPA: hypothetical protein VK808_12620 [Bacteroidia bacterium]|jgi:hypothetical protein|nr:hypothetical protein [Bacteroidia bacterium]
MHPERIYFEKLKSEISGKYRQKNPGIPENLSEWNGKTIEGFQNDLQQEVKSAISVRWFYTHIKADNENKIPRTDVLDLLCRYAGYSGWAEFVAKKKEEGIGSKESNPKANRRNYNKVLMIPILLIIFVLAGWAILKRSSDNPYKFCLVDSDTGTPIRNSKIEIKLLKDNESPQSLLCDSNGCFSLESAAEKVKFVVNAEYYYPDTLIRTLPDQSLSESIMLKPDDYAMMISIFSRSDVQDWEKRRKELESIFTDNAMIFQVDPVNKRAMEIFNKEEFIGKLTVPLSSLKNLEVTETWYTGKQISALRFIQKEDNK